MSFAVEAHDSIASAAYAKSVHDCLTIGADATRPANAHPLLSDAEGEELLEAYLMGTPAKAFAARLERRDIAVFEASIDPYPQREFPEVPMN